MKGKLNLESGGQAMLLRHVEKGIFGVVIALTMLLFYKGVSLESMDSSKSPKRLKDAASSARSTVTATNAWDQVKDERNIDDISTRLQARGGALPTVSQAPYQTNVAWLPPTFPLQGKRVDPELYAPIKVEAKGMYGPLAMVREPTDLGDPINDAVVEEEEEKPKPRRRRRSRRATRGGSGSSMLEEGMAGDSEYGAAMEDMGGSGMGSPQNQVRKPSEEQIDNIRGYRPNNVGGGYTTGAEMGAERGGGRATGPIAKGYYFVTVTALAPHQKQWLEFEQSFADTGAYVPSRDIPKYVYYKVERAEVTGDPDEELKWTALNTRGLLEFSQKWTGVMQEEVDPQYVDPKLTMPAPPLMMRDPLKVMMHSEVPRRELVIAKEEAEEETPLAADGPLSDPDAIFSQGLKKLAGSGASNQYGSGGGEMMMESGDAEMNMMYEGGSGAGYGGGSYGSGGEGGRAAVAAPEVDYKLLRFYDFTARPGKQYRYRVQLWLEDPNHPKLPATEPALSSLGDEVISRLREVKAEEEKSGFRKYWRETPWSEPSEVASVPKQYDIVGGAVSVDRPYELKDNDNKVLATYPKRGAEPSAQLMTVVWDPQKAVDVPGILEVFRGSFLNYQKHAEVVHPLSLQLKKLDHEFQTNNLVLDIRGGAPLPTENKSSDEEPLTVPGEFLVMDENGELRITRELDDLETFRQHHFPEPEPEEKPRQEEDDMGMYGMEEMTDESY